MSWNGGIDLRLPEALRHGIGYLDAAYSYAGGNNERALGRFFAKFPDARKKFWLTSKSNRHEPEGYEALLQESLERMQTSHVDAYFLHGLKDPA